MFWKSSVSITKIQLVCLTAQKLECVCVCSFNSHDTDTIGGMSSEHSDRLLCLVQMSLPDNRTKNSSEGRREETADGY